MKMKLEGDARGMITKELLHCFQVNADRAKGGRVSGALCAWSAAARRVASVRSARRSSTPCAARTASPTATNASCATKPASISARSPCYTRGHAVSTEYYLPIHLNYPDHQ